MKIEPKALNLDEQHVALANYFPSGAAFGAVRVVGTNLYMLVSGLVNEFAIVDGFVRLFRRDTVPDQTENFINEWESALGIPDGCFKGALAEPVNPPNPDNAGTRRRDITAKLSALGIQTNNDFVLLASLFGLTITVKSGILSQPGGYGTDKIARHTIEIEPITPIGETFTYQFPIHFGTSIQVTVECLFDKLKPANCQVIWP